MRKRALSLLLALALTLTLSPAPAAAYGGQAPRLAPASAPEEPAPAHGSSPALAESASAAIGWEEAVLYTAETSSAPWTQSSYGAAVDENEVYRTINSYRSIYPEGTHWTNEDNEYVLSVPYYDENGRRNWTMTGYGCVAFCYELLDAAFDTPIAYKVHGFTYDDIRIGDCLRVDNDRHIVMVIEKKSDHVVLAEGNFNSSVHWDRTMTRAEVMQADYLVTRYPKPAPESLDIFVESTTVPLGEAANIYIRSPMTAPYTIKFWKGAMDSGNPIAVGRDIPATHWYWYAPNDAGLYTVCVETVNADGRPISGTATFYATDGSPSDVTVSTDKSSYSFGETVYFSYSADNADRYEISIWLGEYDTGEPVSFLTSRSNADTFRPEKAGTYTLRVEAVNGKGAASAACRFTVTGGPPSNLKLSTDKSSYALGETVTITCSADDADSFSVSIWRGEYKTGTQVFSGGYTAGRGRFEPAETGTFTVYAEAVNRYGAVSATSRFTVTVTAAPSNVTLTADRSDPVVGVPFNVSVAATDMTGFNVEIWRGGYQTGVLEGSEDDFAPGVPIEVTLGSTAIYTLYVEVYNDYGTASATMRLRAVVNASGAQFTDVPRDAYYAGAVDWALKAGVTTGTGDTEFSPDDTVTRAQAVTFLWRAVGQPVPSASYNKFRDVYDSEYYYEAVQWAVENGVTNGVSDTEFDPYGAVTRGQMITFLWRSLGRPGDTGQGEWYADAEYWARSNSLLTGTALIYATGAGCPRGDVVYYMWNALA